MPLPITDKEKIELTNKIFYLFAEHGFDGISMDEVAKRTKLSKATLYKYFKSKEDIVRDMVDELISHFDSVKFTTDDSIGGVLDSISVGYFKAVLATASSSSKFLSDLKNKFPEIYSDYLSALESVQTRFIAFYKCAAKAGFCKSVSIDIVVEQIKRTLPAIINSSYLNMHQTSLSVIIKEYYRLLLCQLLSSEYTAVIDQDDVYLFADKLVAVMKSKFLIP
ncbi:TetR/AcrR family transcriptional regulator [Lacrimispora brassicae]